MNILVRKISNFLIDRDFKIILSLLLLLIIFPAFGRNLQEQDLMISFMFTIILLASLGCLINDLKFFFWSLFLGILAIVLTWIQYEIPWQKVISSLLYLTYTSFFIILFIHIMKTLFYNPVINLNLVFGALSGYIIIGLIGCFLMILLNINYPSSYSYQDNYYLSTYDFIYYSFINLTTLGYGDILPVRSLSKALSIIHALFGQLYLTVIVAIMVGKFLNNSIHFKDKQNEEI